MPTHLSSPVNIDIDLRDQVKKNMVIKVNLTLRKVFVVRLGFFFIWLGCKIAGVGFEAE